MKIAIRIDVLLSIDYLSNLESRQDYIIFLVNKRQLLIYIFIEQYIDNLITKIDYS